jgi:hypothetical protein
MGRIRRTELRRRRGRRQKLAKMRARYETASTDTERAALLEKLLKVAPGLASELRGKADAAALAAPPTGPVARKRAKAGQEKAAAPQPGAAARESKEPQSGGKSSEAPRDQADPTVSAG